MGTTTRVTMCTVGSDLISDIYESLSKIKGLRAKISSILVDRDGEDENVLLITKIYY